MLTTKQIKFLKKEAHHLTPIFQIGKGGMNDEMITQIGEALEKRELIKVALLQNTFLDSKEVAHIISEQLDVSVVQIIGHTVVLYKQSNTEKYRKISPLVKKI